MGVKDRILEKKIEVAKNNIYEWYEYWEGKVYVAYSGGKDSTALLHLVRSLYPEVRAVFFNTGLELPEIVSFVKKTENVTKLRPKHPFHEIIKKYGYPIISKSVSERIYQIRHSNLLGPKNRMLYWNTVYQLPKKYRYLLAAPFLISSKCCFFMKKQVGELFVKETGLQPMIGVMASDSRLRERSWQRFGCNAFEKKEPQSRPIMSWDSGDVWAYIKKEKLPYASVYDRGWRQTGCMFCAYGILRDRIPNRFQRMKETHPKQYEYMIGKLGFGPVLDFIGVPYQ